MVAEYSVAEAEGASTSATGSAIGGPDVMDVCVPVAIEGYL